MFLLCAHEWGRAARRAERADRSAWPARPVLRAWQKLSAVFVILFRPGRVAKGAHSRCLHCAVQFGAEIPA
eukprot:6212082-Pyramimonas_sp.AAC.1